MDALSQLNELRLDGSSITTLPESIKNLPRLEILSLENCKQLVSVPELPPFIKELNANNCTSLVWVATLRSSATKMIGKMKHILIKDCLKLDQTDSIADDLHITMTSAAFHNVLVRSFDNRVHSYNYNRIEVCLSGNSIPSHFKSRTTEPSSITTRLPDLTSVLGFLLSVVLSPSVGVKQGMASCKIYCRCRSADGTLIGNRTGWSSDIETINSDHVLVWYDPFFCDAILKTRERQVSFEFFTDDGLGVIKDCGVRVVHACEFQSVLGAIDLEHEQKVDLGVKLGLALDIQRQVDSDFCLSAS